MLVGCYISGFVLFTNATLILVGAFSHGGYRNGIGTIFRGSQEDVDYWNTAHHLLFSALSTALLTSSNYCTQILCAPTRAELDTAHSKGTWLDVGILSIRNFFPIERKRAFLGLLLALSSAPLHLFYNAAIFKVTTAHGYKLDFVNSSDTTVLSHLNSTSNLTEDIWKSRYSTPYALDTGDLYLVVDSIGLLVNFVGEHPPCFSAPPNITNALGILNSTTGIQGGQIQFAYLSRNPQFSFCDGSSFTWPQSRKMNLSEPSGLPQLLQYGSGTWISNKDPGTILPAPFHIAYGLAVPSSNVSEVQISLHFMVVVVVVCNTLKLVVMVWTLKTSLCFQLVTVGDAIGSFLENPELGTLGMCILDKDAVLKRTASYPIWKPRVARYSRIFGNNHYVSGLILPLIGVATFVITLSTYWASGMDNSWGAASPHRIWFAPNSFDSEGILLNAFPSNCLQFALSMAYFSLNRLCTSMCLESIRLITQRPASHQANW